MEVTEYTIFNLEKISKIEKDILIALGDDINNRYRYYEYFAGKYKLLGDTINLIKRNNNYTDEQIYDGLSTLCLKTLIGIKSEVIFGGSDYLAVNERNTAIYTKDNYVGFIYFINNILMHNRKILRDDTLSFEGEKLEEGYIDICLDILKGLPLGKEKGNIASKIEKYRFQKDEEGIINLLYYIRIVQLSSWINECIENHPDDYINHIARHYFDRSKMRLMPYIVLTQHINHGTNGQQMVDHIRQIQVDERYRDFKALEAKFDDIKEKVDGNLLRNIEIISIFVAVITLIIGNVSFVPQISAKTTLGVVGLILTINGCLLTGTFTLAYVISKLVSIEIKVLKRFWVFLLLILVLLLGGGGFTICDNLSINAELKIESTAPSIQNGLTIENNINASNSNDKPTVTENAEPSSSSEAQPTPTPESEQTE